MSSDYHFEQHSFKPRDFLLVIYIKEVIRDMHRCLYKCVAASFIILEMMLNIFAIMYDAVI